MKAVDPICCMDSSFIYISRMVKENCPKTAQQWLRRRVAGTLGQILHGGRLAMSAKATILETTETIKGATRKIKKIIEEF